MKLPTQSSLLTKTVHKLLFLDDDPQRHKVFGDIVLGAVNHEVDVTQVMNAKDAIQALTDNDFDLIFLDHDLGLQQMESSLVENSGYKVACFIEENFEESPPIVLHTMNTVGVQNMMRALRNHEVIVAPFGTNIFVQTIDVLLRNLKIKAQENDNG